MQSALFLKTSINLTHIPLVVRSLMFKKELNSKKIFFRRTFFTQLMKKLRIFCLLIMLKSLLVMGILSSSVSMELIWWNKFKTIFPYCFQPWKICLITIISRSQTNNIQFDFMTGSMKNSSKRPKSYLFLMFVK